MKAPVFIPFHWLIQLLWAVDSDNSMPDLEDNAFSQLQSMGVPADYVIRFVYEGRDNDYSAPAAPIHQLPVTQQHTKEV